MVIDSESWALAGEGGDRAWGDRLIGKDKDRHLWFLMSHLLFVCLFVAGVQGGLNLICRELKTRLDTVHDVQLEIRTEYF